ncbi:MAG: nicotinate-nucleotide adenylyltransferase [Muribaculaceae bacterium]|nr:nicotinate-nucleotide adenylyltransferase [Muribaculaceae bacterium]
MALEETIGILGGSFNPVHIGHLMLAQYVREWGYADKVWLTLSPQNPLKSSASLMPDMKRLHMLNRATKDIKGIETCDIELSMPRPSFTINTLDTLSKRYPSKKFKLIIGSDNWAVFEKWKEWQRILDEYSVLVYPRLGYPIENQNVDGMEVIEAPIIDISSTFVRQAVTQGRDVSFFLPAGVYKYIIDNKLYQNKS